MKNYSDCPKCQSNNIIRVDGVSGAYGTGNNIQTGFSVFSAVKVNRYICTDCGFVEEWIDIKDLDKLKKKYPQIDKI